MTDKFCSNCAWTTKPLLYDYDYSQCTLPGVVKPDLVTGYTVYPMCWVARRVESKCGPEGKCWEPKPTFWQRFVARFKA